MAGIDSLEGTLYYQYLINNNSTSTMLNAISGTDSTDSISSLGSLGSLGTIGSLDTGSSFASILQSYLSGINNTDSLTAASMADKLSGVLEEAAKTEDTSSLSYQTVQELYEYFSNQLSAKASSLLGNTSSSQDTGSTESTSSQRGTSTGNLSQMEELNQKILQGQEVDFSEVDSIVESAFAEVTPMQ